MTTTTLPPLEILDDLTTFLYWFLEAPIALLKPPEVGAVTAHESVVTLTLLKVPPYQVELVTLLPNSPAWPGQHCHPNVDSYEVALFNSLDFIKNGEVCNGPERVVPVKYCGTTLHAGCVRLLPTDWHGTKPLKGGAALISVQKWLNGVEPTSVGNDWKGEPTTPGHAQLLKDRGNSAIGEVVKI
jgi:hypothetical protein